MRLIIGLGNPGKEFENTPHNVGTFVLQKIVENQKMADFEINKKLKAEISENTGFNICLLFDTYMNESGSPIAKLAKHFGAKTDNIIIAHDDSDLLLGNYKLQHNRGSAGHKGVESIIKSLKTKRFWRLRIGIRPVKSLSKNKLRDLSRAKSREKAGDFVLKKFSKKEIAVIEGLVPNITREIYDWLGD